MNCPKCGNPIKPNMKFCAKCGTPIAPAQTMQPNNAAPQQPAQPIQQRPVAPQQSAQPIQQRTAASQQPVQPMQSNNAVQQPQPAKKKRKKKKNLGLRITAIILVIAVLAMGGVYLADVLLYKNEVQKEGYITDFPVLKQKTQLLVIDEKEFPVDEYEIKVEEHKLGGILKSDALGRTEEVFKDKSNNPIYDITFPNDGNYRITLTGVVSSRINEAPSAENNDKTEEKTETIVIIIEVKVDDDDENAIDKAAITSKEGDGPVELPEQQPTDTTTSDVYLEATDADFEELKALLSNLQPFLMQFEYSSSDADAYETLLCELSHPFGDVQMYYYIYNEVIESIDVNDNTEPDPFNQLGYAYIKYPAEKLDWIIENIFNVVPDRSVATPTGEYADQLYYHDGYYYFSVDYGGDIVMEHLEIDDKLVDENNVYTVKYSKVFDEDNTDRETYIVKCVLKNIDGKKYWSLFAIERAQEIPTDAVEFNGHYYKVYDVTGKNFDEAREYCYNLGGELATITSAEEQSFITGILPAESYARLYWVNSCINNGQWVWINGESMSYTNWCPGEPSGGQNCLTVLGTYFNENAGKWLDNPPDGAGEPWTLNATGFICEWEKPVL